MPHFSFGRILIEYLIDDGANKLWFKILLPLPIHRAWWASIGTVVFYFLFYMYLDAIIPNTYGIARPCCFCLKSKSGNKSSIIRKVLCCFKKEQKVNATSNEVLP